MKRKFLAVSFLLGFLFVMIALGNSSARDILVSGQEMNKNEVQVTRETVKYPQKEKEIFDGINEAAHMRKLGLGGKKVMTQKGSTSVESENEHGAGGTSKISGEENDSLRKYHRSPPEQLDDQKKHMTMLEPKATKFSYFVIPSSASNTNTKNSQDSNASLKSSSSLQRKLYEDHHGSNEKDETQTLLEAAKEIVNLMHKDYKGMARRKPPINNNEPRT